MTSEAEIDRLIASWDERLSRVDENLIALESDATYQMLSGRSGQRATLEGVTRARVLPALEALSQLFEHRQRLTEVVDRAKEVRAAVGFWDKDQKLAEIDKLLHGPSIKMGPAATPLSRRNLLDPAASDVAVVPEQLLFAMSRAYEVARDAVIDVAQAWARLEPFVAGVERELASLRDGIGELGDAQAGPELEWLEGELARVRTFVATDPLGVDAGAEAVLAPRMGELRRRLEEQRATRARVASGLEAAAALERECTATNAAARVAPERATREIADLRLAVPVDEELLFGLTGWREKLEATARAGRHSAADVGLKRWLETARGYLARDRALVAALEDAIEARTTLSGRLSARRAQAAALVAKGLAAPDLEERGRVAETLLRARPTAMDEATRAVDAFEKAILRLAERERRR